PCKLFIRQGYLLGARRVRRSQLRANIRKRPPNTVEIRIGTERSRAESRGGAARNYVSPAGILWRACRKFRARRRFSRPYLPPVAHRYSTECDLDGRELKKM